MNASALRNGMEISQPAISQHLSVLRGAKLVREKRQGRFVNYEVDPEGLTLIAQWLAKYRAYIRDRAANFGVEQPRESRGGWRSSRDRPPSFRSRPKEFEQMSGQLSADDGSRSESETSWLKIWGKRCFRGAR